MATVSVHGLATMSPGSDSGSEPLPTIARWRLRCGHSRTRRRRSTRRGDQGERRRRSSSVRQDSCAPSVAARKHAPSEIMIREDRDSDHGRLWPD